MRCNCNPIVKIVLTGLIAAFATSLCVINIIDQPNVESTECILLKAQYINHLWHNDWEYNFNNKLYTYQDRSAYKLQNHTCCILVSEPTIANICDDGDGPIGIIIALVAIWGVAIIYMVYTYKTRYVEIIYEYDDVYSRF